MQPSKAQIGILYLASVLLMLVVFHKPLGLPDYSEIGFLVASGLCCIIYSILRRRQKSGLSPSSETLPSPADARRQRNVRLLSFFLTIGVVLAGPFWLPYTGLTLPFPQLVIGAIVICILFVVIYLIASRNATPRV